jgi:hypothetical protein
MTTRPDRGGAARPSLFISYSRDDAGFVRRLVAALEQRGCDVYIDEDDIPAASAWREELEDGIAGSDNIVFVLSPSFVRSEECRKELDHALASGKRLIPLALAECDDVPAELAARNYIWFRDAGDFAGSVETLRRALTTDLEFTRLHSRLVVRHNDWEAHGRSGAYLLRGAELTGAEGWVEQSEGITEPSPPPALLRYIAVSRQAASRRRHLLVLAGAIGLVLVMATAWFYQRQRDETIARHVADAYQWLRREPLRSLDATFAALAVGDSPAAERALAAAREIAVARIQNVRDEATLEGRPGLFGIGVMRWRQGDVYSRLRSDGRYALIASKRDPDNASEGPGHVYLLDMNSMRTVELENEETGWRRLEYMGFSSDGGRIFVTRQFDLDVYDLDGQLVTSQQLGRTAQPLHIAVGYFADTWILVCDSERQLWLADTATRRVSRWMERTPNAPAVLAEPNLAGDQAVVVFEDGTVALLVVDDPNEPTLVALETRAVTFATFHDPTRRFATANEAGVIELWESGSGTPIASFEQGAPAGLVGFSDDGERLIAIAEDGSVHLWSIATRTLLASRGPPAEP